ncbi:unnamed protein product [Orchesella dallaii]|uniref:Protein with signal anchor n=1 Tax=Orchesella dallaii TaxID=48710 RepID=A0ABP1S3P4_9HEXA
MAKVAMDDMAENFKQMEGLEEDDEKLQEFLKNLQDQILVGTKEASVRQTLGIHWSVYILAFAVIFGVVGFFSYKLVQSLKEKERKREEKRKLKEMKKKK